MYSKPCKESYVAFHLTIDGTKVLKNVLHDDLVFNGTLMDLYLIQVYISGRFGSNRTTSFNLNMYVK